MSKEQERDLRAILAESVTVSETKDGFAVEIANVDLDRHIHETGTPVTLAGVEFMHRT